uniref:Sulfotransferase n=1 Tax=Naja naja TaxID=35670 RepID=A0A8C7DS02_NAJNA
MESLDAIKCPKLVEFEGIPMLNEMVENWNLISGFQARPDDLLLCTYPKAGTTWIQEIVDMVQHKGNAQKCARAPIYERSPYIELFPPKPIPSGESQTSGCPSPSSKISTDGAPTTPEDTFYKMTLDSHNLIHYISCSNLSFPPQNPAQEIQKVAQFLNIELSASVLDQIVQHTTFECMKDNPMTNYSNMPSVFMDQNISPFMRKGTVGNWKEHFTVAQSQQMDKIYTQQLGNTGLKFRTEL